MFFIGIIFPKGMKYLIAAPLVGTALGGFSRAILAMMMSQFNTMFSFGTCVLSGIILAESVAVLSDINGTNE